MSDRAVYAVADARCLPLADRSVHMIATSPPYFQLRRYDTGDHKGKELGTEALRDCGAWARRSIIGYRGVPEFEADGEGNAIFVGRPPEPIYGPPAPPCGACYVCNMRTWAAEMYRVLRDDGCMFLNLGDSYAGGDNGGGGSFAKDGLRAARLGVKKNDGARDGARGVVGSLKPKDLTGIPWRVALALQADGWYLRRDVIWQKPNALPERVNDRPSTSHEYIFLLTKRPRYFWDAEAIKEPSVEPERVRADRFGGVAQQERGRHSEGSLFTGAAWRNRRSVWTVNTTPYAGSHFATFPPALVEIMVRAGSSEYGVCPECGAPWQRVVDKGEAVNAPRNPNGVRPYTADGSTNHGTGATTLHKVRVVSTLGWRPSCTCNQNSLDLRPDDFDVIATPTGSRASADPSLIVGRAGYSRPRGDNEGQRPITRYEQRHYAAQLRQSAAKAQMANEAGSAFSHYLRTDHSGARPIPPELLERWIDAGWLERVTVPEFRPYAPVPAIVLDSFVGSGTTLEVARKFGRVGLGFDLSETYLRDNAATRLGHDKLAAWGRGIAAGDADHDALPLFAMT